LFHGARQKTDFGPLSAFGGIPELTGP